MTVKEMALNYYPVLWNKNRIDALLHAKKITQEEHKEIINKTNTNN